MSLLKKKYVKATEQSYDLLKLLGHKPIAVTVRKDGLENGYYVLDNESRMKSNVNTDHFMQTLIERGYDEAFLEEPESAKITIKIEIETEITVYRNDEDTIADAIKYELDELHYQREDLGSVLDNDDINKVKITQIHKED